MPLSYKFWKALRTVGLWKKHRVRYWILFMLSIMCIFTESCTAISPAETRRSLQVSTFGYRNTSHCPGKCSEFPTLETSAESWGIIEISGITRMLKAHGLWKLMRRSIKGGVIQCWIPNFWKWLLSGTASVLRSSITPLCEAMRLERCHSCVLLELVLAVQMCACSKKNDIENTWLLHNPKEVVGFDVAGLKSVHRRLYSSEFVIVTVDSKTSPESTWKLLHVQALAEKDEWSQGWWCLSSCQPTGRLLSFSSWARDPSAAQR